MSYVIGRGRYARETYPVSAPPAPAAVLANHKEFTSVVEPAAAPIIFDTPPASFTTLTGKVRVIAGSSPSNSGGTAVSGDAIEFQLRVDGVVVGPSSGLGGVPVSVDTMETGATAGGPFGFVDGELVAELAGFVPGSSHTFGIQATDLNVPARTMTLDAGRAYVNIQDIL